MRLLGRNCVPAARRAFLPRGEVCGLLRTESRHIGGWLPSLDRNDPQSLQRAVLLTGAQISARGFVPEETF